MLTGCVSSRSTRIGTAPIRPAVAVEQVVIYRTADQVDGRYEEVALLNAAGDHTFASEERLYQSLRKEAADLGANAIILDQVIEPNVEPRMSGKWWLEVSHAVYNNVINPPNRRAKAIAIYVYRD
jgi:hypothetical protein